MCKEFNSQFYKMKVHYKLYFTKCIMLSLFLNREKKIVQEKLSKTVFTVTNVKRCLKQVLIYYIFSYI